MVRLVLRVLKISVSIFRRELTRIIYMCLPYVFRSQIPKRFAVKVEQGRQSAWDPASFEDQEDLRGHQCLQTASAGRLRKDFLVGGFLSSSSFTLQWAADPYGDHDTSNSLQRP